MLARCVTNPTGFLLCNIGRIWVVLIHGGRSGARSVPRHVKTGLAPGRSAPTRHLTLSTVPESPRRFPQHPTATFSPLASCRRVHQIKDTHKDLQVAEGTYHTML